MSPAADRGFLVKGLQETKLHRQSGKRAAAVQQHAVLVELQGHFPLLERQAGCSRGQRDLRKLPLRRQVDHVERHHPEQRHFKMHPPVRPAHDLVRRKAQGLCIAEGLCIEHPENIRYRPLDIGVDRRKIVADGVNAGERDLRPFQRDAIQTPGCYRRIKTLFGNMQRAANLERRGQRRQVMHRDVLERHIGVNRDIPEPGLRADIQMPGDPRSNFRNRPVPQVSGGPPARYLEQFRRPVILDVAHGQAGDLGRKFQRRVGQVLQRSLQHDDHAVSLEDEIAQSGCILAAVIADLKAQAVINQRGRQHGINGYFPVGRGRDHINAFERAKILQGKGDAAAEPARYREIDRHLRKPGKNKIGRQSLEQHGTVKPAAAVKIVAVAPDLDALCANREIGPCFNPPAIAFTLERPVEPRQSDIAHLSGIVFYTDGGASQRKSLKPLKAG